ncbi:uncharacterized protein LOC113208176 [Frankliniella occidentalis]|uniref:Uncharacterized protein LOC113208176 n=1 Tax=Frankliniella occidentalis TaxID=133901 RepID=A0A6J1SQR1_FRAOC|nr:uncharacterized protein LOC113208176 [Frankliniella occidentalis]
MQALLRKEGGEEGREVDCCPSVMDVTQPKGGRNEDGMYVELYMGNNPYNETQRFYEFSCRKDVLDRPCLFVDRKLRNQSRCVQKYSLQYAIVRADEHDPTSNTFFPNGPSGWKLDYIKLRSGCSCVVKPKRQGKGYKGHGSRERALAGPSLGGVNEDPLDNT